MGKAFLGLLVGIALTSLVFVLLTDEPAAPVPGQVTAVAPFYRNASGSGDSPPVTVAPTTAEAARADRPTVTVSERNDLPDSLLRFASREDWTREEALTLFDAWTDEELRALEKRAQEVTQPTREMQDAERLVELARSELRRRELIAAYAAQPPPDLPIELPPEFNWLAEHPNGLHETIQRQPVDSAWSLQTEANLRRFLMSRPQVTGTYGVPTITCRTSICQIAFVVPGMEDPGPDARSGARDGRGRVSRDISEAIRPIYDQPWANQLDRGQEYREVTFRPGAATILLHIRRTEP